jgi:hypothetical protein
MHLSEGYPVCENWERKSWEMMMRGRYYQSRRGSWNQDAQVSLRNKSKRAQNKQKSKRTKTDKADEYLNTAS